VLQCAGCALSEHQKLAVLSHGSFFPRSFPRAPGAKLDAAEYPYPAAPKSFEKTSITFVVSADFVVFLFTDLAIYHFTGI